MKKELNPVVGGRGGVRVAPAYYRPRFFTVGSTFGGYLFGNESFGCLLLNFES